MLNSIVGFLIIIPIYIVFLVIGIKKQISLFKQLVLLVFFCYIGVTVAVTLFPFPYDTEFIKQNVESQYLSNNFIPFKGIYSLIKNDSLNVILRNILGNILLATPLGFLIPMLFEKARNIKKIFWIGAGFSIAIEGSQFLFSILLGYTYKITDVDDIILNIVGALIGYIAFKLVCIIKE